MFLKHGAKVVIADVQDQLGHAICQDLEGSYNIAYVHCDVTSESDVQNAVNLAVSLHGKLDIMFNNAGIAGDPRLVKVVDTDLESFKRVCEVNLIGGFLGAKHASRVMIEGKIKGCILFTSSIASVMYSDITHAYVASKHAVVGLAKNLSVELGQYGIRVNCISPHAVATPLLRRAMGMLEKEKVEELVSAAGILKGSVLEPEDVAEGALYLASQDSKYVSGINLVIDGGFSLTNPSLSKQSVHRLLSSLTL